VENFTNVAVKISEILLIFFIENLSHILIMPYLSSFRLCGNRMPLWYNGLQPDFTGYSVMACVNCLLQNVNFMQ